MRTDFLAYSETPQYFFLSRPAIWVWMAFIAASCLIPSTSMAKEVVAVVDMQIRPYVEALAGFEEASKADVWVFERKEDNDPSDELSLIPVIRKRRPDQILAIGSEALEVIAGEISDIPIIFCMVLNPGKKIKKYGGNMTGVSMNVPPEKTMSLLSQLLPSVGKVGVVYNPEETGFLVDAGRKALAGRHKEMAARPVKSEKEALQTVKTVFEESDAYWIVPDRTVQNADVLRYLFFAAHKEKKALIGISDKYAKAGALFALTVESKALGRQAGAMSNRVLAGTPLEDIPFENARYFNLSINSKTARELGVKIPEQLLGRASHVY